jgi:hypothetical protein
MQGTCVHLPERLRAPLEVKLLLGVCCAVFFSAVCSSRWIFEA